jgi:hypothetical protein
MGETPAFSEHLRHLLVHDQRRSGKKNARSRQQQTEVPE